MSTGRRWQDIKAEAHRRNPELAEPERQARARAELDAYVAGHHLKELHKARPGRASPSAGPLSR
jgi:hypothetical protein